MKIIKCAGLAFIENTKNGKIYIIKSKSNINKRLEDTIFLLRKQIFRFNEELRHDFYLSPSSFNFFFEVYDDLYKLSKDHETYLEVFSDCTYNHNCKNRNEKRRVNKPEKTEEEKKKEEITKEQREQKKREKINRVKELTLHQKNRIALKKFIKYRQAIKEMKKDMKLDELDIENEIDEIFSPETIGVNTIETMYMNIQGVRI